MKSIHRSSLRNVAGAAALFFITAVAWAAPLTFFIGPYPSKGIIEYRLDAADYRKAHPTAKTLAIVVKRDGSTITNISTPISAEGTAQGLLDVGKMPNGASYRVTGTVEDGDGQNLIADTEGFTRHVQPFETAKPTGLSDIIVPPFTAPVIDQSSVSCVERTYQHGAGGLLTQVIAAGQPLLASPAVFKARTGDGKLVMLQGDAPVLAAVGKGQASYAQNFTGQGITLKVQGAFDYDGFYLFTVELAPSAGPVTLHDLQLELPYRGQIAQLIDAAVTWRRIEGEHKECLGALDSKQGVLWDSKTFPDRNWARIGNMPPYIWLGDDDRGMVYSCASSQGMDDDENLPAAQVQRVDDTVVYTAWFVNTDLQLSAARQFQFALQASPFKPMTKNASLWRNAGYREPYTNGILFTNWFTDGSYPTYGRFLTLPLLKKYRDATGVDQAGTMASAVSECGGTPEYQQFWHEWGSGLGWNKQTPRPPEEWAVKMIKEAKLPLNPFIRVESASDVSATNRDYRVWWYNEEVRHAGISFIYQDNPPDVTYYDPPNGYGYTRDDGKQEPTSAIWNSRTFMKRIATTAIEDGKTDSVYIWANAINPALPGRSFCRKMLNGEYLYTKLLTLSQLRVLASHQWGMELDWYPFPQTEESPYPNIGPVRKYWRAVFSRLLLHDITNFSGGDDSGFCERWIDALDLFWLDDPSVKWHAYYQPDAIKAANETTYVSTYTADGRALFFVSNQASKPVVESVPMLGLARLGQGDLKYFYDAETGEQIETDDALHMFIPGDDYRVVIGFSTPWQFAAKTALGKSDLPAQSTLDPEDTLTAISKQLLTSRTLAPVENADQLYERWMQKVMEDLPVSPDIQYLDAKACASVKFEKPGIQASLLYDKKRSVYLVNYYNNSDEDVRLSDNVRKELQAKVGQSGHEYILQPVTGISEWAFIDIPSHRGLLEIWYTDTPDFWKKHAGPFKASTMLANIREADEARQKEMGGRATAKN